MKEKRNNDYCFYPFEYCGKIDCMENWNYNLSNRKILNIQVILAHLVCYVNSISQFINNHELPIISSWNIQQILLITISLLFGLITINIKHYYYVSLYIQMVCLFVISFPYNVGNIYFYSLSSCIILEIILLLTMENIVLSLSLLFFGVILFRYKLLLPTFMSIGVVNNVSVLYQNPEILFYLIAMISLSFKIREVETIAMKSNLQRAKSEVIIETLTNKNILIQGNAIQQKEKTISEERKRVVGEIHDITGYSYVNILLLLQTCETLCDKGELLKAKEYIQKTIVQTKKGLNDVRQVMSVLHNEKKIDDIANRLYDLVKSFQEITKVKTTINFGAMPFSFGMDIDNILYHVVQEGLTNSIRHGNPSLISISLWTDKNHLHLVITDNGSKEKVFEKGIGLLTMEQRLKEINGTLNAVSSEYGFSLIVDLFFKSDKDEYAKN